MPAYNGYDQAINPSIGALFSGAAFRYGHSLASPDLDLLDASGDPLANSPLSLRDAFFNPNPIKNDGIEPVLRGMAQQLVEELDAQVIDNLRNFLFGPPGSGGLDLVSVNIQRGRDLGLPSYNDTRRELGMTPVTFFADITSDTGVRDKLSSIYSDVERVDLWVGGLAEDHKSGAIVGETFWTIIRDQFQRTRDGDRFWYENSQFTPTDLAAIRATTLSSVIVQNTSIASLPTSVFTTQAIPAPFGSANSNRTEFAYDVLNRLTEITETDPDGAGPLISPVTMFRYDARGNLIETTDAAGSTTIAEFDPRDRPNLIRDELGNETSYTYDPNGNLRSTTDPNSNRTRFTYDSRNRHIETIDPDDGIITFRYDADDNLVSLIDPNANVTRFAYDTRDRLVREVDPLGAQTLFTYDMADNLISHTDRIGRVIEFEYDDIGRLSRKLG